MSYRLRRSLVLTSLSLTLLTSGCGILMPKQVELFQRKVKPVPELSDSAEETQRQAADRLARELQSAHDAALHENSSTNVVTPLQGANNVADALSESLGPPSKPYTGSTDNLAAALRRNLAKLNAAIQKYADNVQKDVGKKIEGTGLIQIGYFHMLGGILLLGALIWFGLRVYGIFNPIVGGVTSTIGRVSSSLLHKGFTQVVAGGEHFKDALDQSTLPEDTVRYVKQLFAAHQKQAQDEDVKKVIAGITVYPDTTPLPPIPPGAPPA